MAWIRKSEPRPTTLLFTVSPSILLRALAWSEGRAISVRALIPSMAALSSHGRFFGAAHAAPAEKNGYAPGWFRSIEYALTGSNWCGVGNPPDVWAGTCVHSQQDGACRRHDMCNVVERLPEPMFGLALACACDRDLYQGSTEDLERTLYGEGSGWPCVDCLFANGPDAPCTHTLKFQDKYKDVFEWPQLYKTDTLDGCSLHNLTCNLCHDDISPSPPPPSPPFPPMYPYGWLIGFIGSNQTALGWFGIQNFDPLSEAIDLTGHIPYDISSSLPSGVSNSLPSGISASLPSGISNSLPSGISASLPSGISSSFPSGISASLPSGISSSLPSGISSSLPSGISASLPSGISSSLPSDISTYAALPGMLSGWGGARLRNATGWRLVPTTPAGIATPPPHFAALTLPGFALLIPALVLFSVLLRWHLRPPPLFISPPHDGATAGVSSHGEVASNAGSVVVRPAGGRQREHQPSNLDLI